MHMNFKKYNLTIYTKQLFWKMRDTGLRLLVSFLILLCGNVRQVRSTAWRLGFIL